MALCWLMIARRASSAWMASTAAVLSSINTCGGALASPTTGCGGGFFLQGPGLLIGMPAASRGSLAAAAAAAASVLLGVGSGVIMSPRRSLIGTPSAPLMTVGGASTCGGLMVAAVGTVITGWMTFANGDWTPGHDRHPQPGCHWSQLRNLACSWQPSKSLPQAEQSKCGQPPMLHGHKFCRVFLSYRMGSPNCKESPSLPTTPHVVQCVLFKKHLGQYVKKAVRAC